MKLRFFQRPGYQLRPDTILWLEGDGNYTRIHWRHRRPQLMAYTLKRFEERLADFVRIRRGVLVNPHYILHYRRAGGQELSLYLKDGTVLQTSRRRLATVYRQLQNLTVS